MTNTLTDLSQDLAEVRQRTLELVAPLSSEQMETQIDPIMSPLVWDLGHIAAYEDLWLNHRYGEMPLLHEELTAVYDAFETPRDKRGDIEILDTAGSREYLDEVRARTADVLEQKGPDPVLHELVLQHELQHTETMRQAMVMGGLLADQMPVLTGEDRWIEIPAGPFMIGAKSDAFSYDNERPAHEVDFGPFEIASKPVTNATWRHFAEGGGYERREWWSDEAWAWKQEYDIGEPDGLSNSPAQAPVCHVSWYEADAFARFSGARLPTEPEWERAAAAVEDTGLVWEWTTSEFSGYDGFVAHPYKEYSEVFFDRGYRCLRGGSWAADPRVATKTFRNWDLPQRRQIFAGVRLARGNER
jgi:iron(II)-dependent oxidoreductase